MLAVQSPHSSSPFTTTAVAAKKDPPTPSSAAQHAQHASSESVQALQQPHQHQHQQHQHQHQHPQSQQQQQSSSSSSSSALIAAQHLSSSSSHPLVRPSGLDAILKDKIEFVEGSSTGLLGAGVESKYPYINVPPSSDERPSKHSPTTGGSDSPSSSKLAAQRPQIQLYDRPFNMVWAMPHRPNNGFVNTGNTCFLNSVLQCLIHTAPLQHILKQHDSGTDKCRANDGFCMMCKLRDTMENSFRRDRAFIPIGMVNNLQRIAKTMRRGRQEDAHEFLRYSIDALQRSCLAGLPPKVDPKVAETTWVHKLFGGRLRSRVTCTACRHVSDTFDTILDLSIDIQGVSSVTQALSKFVAVDHLRGANKYNCEKCKKAVNAEKRFTIHDAPTCLTVHLKRFTPLGRKIGHLVEYSHTLDLSGAMSEDRHKPSYTLYGVISHAGGGPNSGHYYAHVRGATGTWYEANDEMVTPISSSSVFGRKSAYILFYVRSQGDSLNAALRSSVSKKSEPPKEESRSSIVAPSKPPAKSQAVAAVTSLVPAYAESDDSEDKGEPVLPPSKEAVEEASSTDVARKSQTIGNSSASMPDLLTPIPPSSFYGDSTSKKRKAWVNDEDDDDNDTSKRQRSTSPRALPTSNSNTTTTTSTSALLSSNNPLFNKPPPTIGNPFSRANMANTLNEQRSSHQKIAMVGVGLTKKMKKKPHGLM